MLVLALTFALPLLSVHPSSFIFFITCITVNAFPLILGSLDLFFSPDSFSQINLILFLLSRFFLIFHQTYRFITLFVLSLMNEKNLRFNA
jgi:hypothetical protein